MILKELEPFSGQDKFQVAGRKAEEQMAHYLRRFFGSSNDVDVLNYLRIDLAGEVAQMDHLVLHPYGLLIVESKSVAGSVQIKEDGQWIRWFNKQPQGMRSPVTQAKMQAMLLKELLEKTVRQKGFFEQVHIDVLVAISDSGTIQWPATGSLLEVCKADQVPEKISQRVSEIRGATQLAGVLTAEHRRVVAEFLCKVHKPLAQGVAAQFKEPEPARAPQGVPAADRRNTSSKVHEPTPRGFVAEFKVPEPSRADQAVVAAKRGSEKQQEKGARSAGLPDRACKHCGSSELEARHGQYGYYFYCGKCEKNTGIKFACPACGAEGRLRKQGKEFFAECKGCDGSVLYHSN
jgi:hypothetical protein